MDKGDLFVCLFLTHPHTFPWELAPQFFKFSLTVIHDLQ